MGSRGAILTNGPLSCLGEKVSRAGHGLECNGVLEYGNGKAAARSWSRELEPQ